LSVKRLVASAVLLAVLVWAAVFVYARLSREREYTRLVTAGEVALAAGHTGEAVEAFSGAIAIKRDSMLGYLKRGETYRSRGELNAALRDLRTATRLDPAAPRPLEQSGDVQYAMGRYARAADRYAEYVRLDDRSPRVLYKLGLARYRDGDLAGAIAALRRSAELDDEFAEVRYALGLCLSAGGQLREAAAELEHAVRLSPALTPAREALASVDRTLGRRSGEIDQLQALAGLEPTRLERQIALALAHARQGRVELAVAQLTRAAERFPGQSSASIALGRIWLSVALEHDDRDALTSAIDALSKAVDSGFGGSEALTLLGRARMLSGEPDLAQETLLQATAVFPVDPAAFVYLADAATVNGNRRMARDALISHLALVGDAVRREPGAIAIRIGDLSARLGDTTTAVTWYRRGLAYAGSDAALLGRIAEAEWKTGETGRARDLLERALAIDPANSALLNLQRVIAARP
jgi:tetratricopeptide (TPR) repeat protein